MNDLRMLLAGAVASVLLVACGGAPASPGPAKVDTRAVVALTRSTLTAASDSARGYGRTHLGHFLDLDAARLRRNGLEVPDSISVTVRTTHESFCIKAVNEGLPLLHPWAVASVSSRDPRPSSQDRCVR